MEIRLSHDRICSYAGDVLPLRLLGVTQYGMDRIRWESSAPCVQITGFEQAEKDPFTDGVLLTLLEPGEAQVSAHCQGKRYTCRISVHERCHVASSREISYWISNFHDHTAQTHKREEFPLRKQGIPADYLKQITDEGMLDATVISDHAHLLTDKEFFRGYWDASQVAEENLVIFPGSEAEVSPLWDDRYGIEHKVGGEIVVINCDSYASTSKWETFFARYRTSPFAFGILAHPQIVGTSRKGVWNFNLDKNRGPEFLKLIRGVEMGDGSDRDSNLINEYVYSIALDNGFRVSTTCSADRHGPVWAGKQYPGKTILMAPEKSKEAFWDALDSCRFYASESGNVKLYYEVNEQGAPATLPEASDYRFCVELGLLREDMGGMPVRLQVISDYGKTLWETDKIQREMTFTVHSDTARWFYLRLTDAQGRRTWSVPVWTGREFDPPMEKTAGVPLEKSGFTAVEQESGQDASGLLCDDPTQIFTAQKAPCAILVDMGSVQKISAVSLYHIMLDIKALRAAGENAVEWIARMPVGYQVYTGMTPERMTLQAEGLFRVFGAEEMICFPAHTAQYLRLQILSNAGGESGRPAYENCPVVMAELTVYKPEEELA